MSDSPITIDYSEDGDAWTATIVDKRGRSIITFKYTPSVGKPVSGGVTQGVYKPADEDYKGKRVVSPKSPVQLEKENLEEWDNKTMIEQATNVNHS